MVRMPVSTSPSRQRRSLYRLTGAPRAVAMVTACVLASPAVAQTSSPGPSAWSVSPALDTPAALKLSGSLRARYETVDGQTRPGFESSSDLINLRTTVFAEYDFGSVRLGGELYDSRVWGGNDRTPVTPNEVNTAELVQAYLAVDFVRPFGSDTSATVQAGRMLLNLGSRRLVAADDYRNTTNGYTGVRLDVTAPAGVKATLIYTMPQQRLPNDLPSLLDNRTRTDRESRDAVLWGGVVSRVRTLGPATLEGSYYRFDERDATGRPTRDRALDTWGLRVIGDPKAGDLDYEVELIRQTGTVRSGLGLADPELRVSAGFVHADAGYTFPRWTTRISAEFDYATGDGRGAKFGRFDTLFGMRRADLAPAGLYNAIGRANLVTPGVRIEATPSRRLDLFVVYRGLWLASGTDSFSTTGVRDPVGRSGDFAGQQIEGRARYWLVPNALRFEADAAWLIKGRFLETAPNAGTGDDSHYLSLNLTALF
ncbi:hypothetical protein BH10PSE1_BH10PSE1_25140 [soil metagenome]